MIRIPFLAIVTILLQQYIQIAQGGKHKYIKLFIYT